MSDYPIKTAIVVLHYNNVKLTNQCIESIRAHTAHSTYIIIVVDNNSDHIYTEQVNNSDCIVIRHDENRYNVDGINFGLYYALYKLPYEVDYVVNFDNDIICLDNWLPPLISAMEQDPEVGIVGGKQWNEAQTEWRSVGADLMGMLYNNYPEEDRNVVWLQGSFHMYRVKMLRMIGLHDTRYRIICSDSDFCLHAHDRGWKVRFIHDSNVIHLQNESYGYEAVETDQQDKVNFMQKWTGVKFNALSNKFPFSLPEKKCIEITYRIVDIPEGGGS